MDAADAARPIRVLVIDDSALMRQLITELLSTGHDIRVVGAAPDPYAARTLIKQLNPDVLTLDVEMPRMDGLTFLENLMRLHPMPVVMLSSLTERGAEVTLQALELGAIDFINKPHIDVVHGFNEIAAEIVEKVRTAAATRPRQRLPRPAPPATAPRAAGYRLTHGLIAIGASTGGTEAIREVLSAMPPDSPAVVITQHIPPAFSGPFAQRLDRNSTMHVVEATDNAALLPGHAYVAPGGRHLRVVRDGARFRCKLGDDEPVNRHKPSVDVMFDSVARAAGANCAAALLTGMGDDGARGLLRLREAGAETFVQDEATSVVWGMPGVAWRLGAAEHALPLSEVADRLVSSSHLSTRPSIFSPGSRNQE
ncbi:MAG: chemotaxis response regulator protein-glutamate methylesterase [Nevskiaceae bacterium]|nr:MAG: chemotaxis response regulator protein-glutamate methylesterase [Nevskiaceae bacterium]TBR73175.1 MAG: chemotaxis response regulator protein-glutamate methylesterase [Nevskiaceae bacterium]